MTDPSRDEDLAERVAELEETLAELRGELADPPRGPMGLPRPPSPREVLRFTDRYAIPTAIAVLEANIKLLQLLRGALRLADPERAARDGASETRDRAERVGRAALSRLDDALDDLQTEIEEGGLPSDPESRSIIEDARALTDEIEERLSTGSRPGRDGDPALDDGDREAGPGEGDDAAGEADEDESDDEPIEIDVEGELRSIKDELGKAEGDEGDDDARSDDDEEGGTDTGDGDDAAGDGAGGDDAADTRTPD